LLGGLQGRARAPRMAPRAVDPLLAHAPLQRVQFAQEGVDVQANRLPGKGLVAQVRDSGHQGMGRGTSSQTAESLVPSSSPTINILGGEARASLAMTTTSNPALAAIDIGSSAIRMDIAEEHSDGTLYHLESLKKGVQL